jgi:hypothetical protein
MTKIRTDAFGNEINIGDTVAYNGMDRVRLSCGKIEAFTEYYVKISFKATNSRTGKSFSLTTKKKYESIALIKTK